MATIDAVVDGREATPESDGELIDQRRGDVDKHVVGLDRASRIRASISGEY
jgi:hypothetical protein